MKLHTYTAAAALTGLGLFALSLALGHESTGAFAALVATLLVLGFVRDYAPRQPRWEPTPNVVTAHFPARAQVVCHRGLGARMAA